MITGLQGQFTGPLKAWRDQHGIYWMYSFNDKETLYHSLCGKKPVASSEKFTGKHCSNDYNQFITIIVTFIYLISFTSFTFVYFICK